MRTSIDWIKSSAVGTLNQVLGELDIIEELTLFSDKLGLPELNKMESEYAKEMKRPFQDKIKSTIWKFVQNAP